MMAGTDLKAGQKKDRKGSHKWKRIVKSKHFRSSFIIMLLCITVFFAAGCGFTLMKKRNEMENSLRAKAGQGAAALSDTLHGLENNALFAGTLPSVDRVLSLNRPQPDDFRTIIKDVTPFLSQYNAGNLSLFFLNSGKIYDSNAGLYTFEDYFAPEFLKELKAMDSYQMFHVGMQYKRYYQDHAQPVILYARKLPIYESVCKGFVTVSISMEELRTEAGRADTAGPYTAAAYFQDKLLWCSSAAVMETWDQEQGLKANESHFFDGFYSYSSNSEDGVRWVIYLTGSDLRKAMLPEFLQWLALYALSLITALGLAAVYSVLMLRHVDAIIGRLRSSSLSKESGVVLDEFTLLNAAVDNMNEQLSDIQHVMDENRQLIRERLLSGILYDHVDWSHLSPEYGRNGISFPYPHFAVILISIPELAAVTDYMRREQLMLVVRNNATEAFSVLGQVNSLYLESKIISIILNTSHYDGLTNEFHKICGALKAGFQRTVDLYPLFSIGICSASEPKPFQAWNLALKNFIFTAANPEDYVLISHQSEYVSSINPELLSNFVYGIVDKDFPRLKSLTREFCSVYIREAAEPAEAKRHGTIALCTILAALLELNMDMREGQPASCLKKIGESSTVSECEKAFSTCVYDLSNMAGKVSEESHGYVCTAIEFLEAHFNEPISIPQIADSVGVSSIYLNKIFKLSTGKTLSEYLNFYRINRSMELLANTGDTVAKISEAMGYHDVRSYIRFFKKFNRLTPGEWRRKKEEEEYLK